MLLSVYPNGEVRARVPASVSKPRLDRPLYILDNREKLAIKNLPPVECCCYPRSPWPRVGYGGAPQGRSFSIRARKMLSRVGGIFSPPETKKVVFLTGTLPGSTDEAMAALGRYSSWVVHELFSRMYQVLKIKGADQVWMWCWEFQKRGALHLHVVWEAESAELAEKVKGAFVQMWGSVLRGLARKSGVDVFEKWYGGTHKDSPEDWQIHAQIAYKSPSHYLAKYLSKDASKLLRKWMVPPTRWYQISRHALRAFRQQIVGGSTDVDREEPPQELTQKDLELLVKLEEYACFSVGFPDKIKDGFTLVYYVKEGCMDEVKKIIKGVPKMKYIVGAPVDRNKGVHRYGDSAVRYRSVEDVLNGKRPMSELERWFNREQIELLLLYKNGFNVCAGNLFQVSLSAERYLYYLGWWHESREAPASEAALDEKESEDNGDGGFVEPWIL